MLQRLAGDAVDRAGRGDQDVRVREHLLERADAVSVHVRLERRDRVDLDDGDAATGAARRAGKPLADPAVADDAELAAGEGEVRQPVDRGERRLARAVAVVEQVLAERVVRGDRREGQLARRLHRSQPRDAGGRLFGHAREPGGEVWPVLDDPCRQLRAVVDDDLGKAVRDREQVGVELLPRGAVGRVHLDPSRNERGADRVLGRAGVRAGGDDLRAGVREQRGEVGRLRLQMDDDGDSTALQRAVGEAFARELVEDGRVLCDPANPLLALRSERRVGDPGTSRDVDAPESTR